MSKLTALTYVPNAGWSGRGFILTHAQVDAAEISLQMGPAFGQNETTMIKIENVHSEGNKLHIQTEDFNYRGNWTLKVGEDAYTIKDVDDPQVEGMENFAAKKDGEVIYRLYSPKAKGPRPLILYLHGGGNGGTDNYRNVTSDYGVLSFADRFPDMYIMAPQAPQPENWAPPKAGKGGSAGSVGADFAHSDQTGKNGWHREYLAAVCDIIRGMIAGGQVDRRRVYVTGLSMGGAGTLRAMSVGAGLFAACVPVCPSMTPETFDILRNLVHAKIWIATAYVDHTIYRHKYIVDGIMALRDAGNQDAHLTIYSPEELAAYGIATDPNLSLQARFAANHASWVPTYHNEHGILSWMTDQTLSL